MPRDQPYFLARWTLASHCLVFRLFFFSFDALGTVSLNMSIFLAVVALWTSIAWSSLPFLDFFFVSFQQPLSNDLILGTSSLASRAVTSVLNESGRLASKYTTRSSSSIASPTTASSLNSSVMTLIWSCTDSPSCNCSECSQRRRANLLAHVFFWN